MIHASCVAFGDDGVLIIGPSGSGKTSLAWGLIARGGVLVADDQVALRRDGEDLIATAPPTTRGMIEARGVGLLSLPTVDHARVRLITDVARREHERLPPRRRATLEEINLPLIYVCENQTAADMIAAVMQAGGPTFAD